MSWGVIGALLGLVVGIADLVALRILAGRVELPETKRVLNIVGVSQLALLPVFGYFVAPILMGD